MVSLTEILHSLHVLYVNDNLDNDYMYNKTSINATVRSSNRYNNNSTKTNGQRNIAEK